MNSTFAQTLPHIEEAMKKLVALIRQTSMAQASDWQQIPGLALQLYALGNRSQNNWHAIRAHAWPITLSSELGAGCLYLAIDLNTGDILDWYFDKKRSASDENVLKFASHMELLNAATLVEALKGAIQKKK